MAWVGMAYHPPGHFGDSRTVSFAVDRFVQDGGMPSGREVRCGFEIAGLGREEEGIGRSHDATDSEIRIEELATGQVAAIISGIKASRGRVRQNRVRCGILKGKERIREVIKGVGDAGGAGARDEDKMTAIVREGGTYVKGPNTVVIPRLAFERGVVDHHELAGRMEGMGREIDGRTVKAVPCRQRRV